MCAPVRPGAPLVFGLATGKGLVDLDLVEPRASGHRILIGQNMPAGTQAPRETLQAQKARKA